MEPAATRTNQLTSQTHRLSLPSPFPDGPYSPSAAPSMISLSPATGAVADAQPTTVEIAPMLLSREAVVPAPPAAGACDRIGQSLAVIPDEVVHLDDLPNEVLFHILTFLDVSDLLSASRTSHLFRSLSQTPVLHSYRLQHTRMILPPLLWSRPPLADLVSRSIFMTHTSIVSRRLARSLVSIRLSRRLASRPTAASLVERSVLPKECVPGLCGVYVAPGLVAKKMAIEKERVKDGLRQWIASKWRGKVMEREEGVRRWEESRGIGRVWRLRKFWERVSREGRVADSNSRAG